MTAEPPDVPETPDWPGVPEPPDEMTRLVVDALAGSEPKLAPGPLRARVMEAAHVQRPAGRPRGGERSTPVEAYRRTLDELDDLLADCDAADWAAVVDQYRWTVQGLVGHILAVERLLGTRLGVDNFTVPPELEADHLAMSYRTVTEQSGRDPAATLAEWRAAARQVLDALATLPDLDDQVVVHGVPFRWRDLLVVRSLEVWTHTDDIRRATGRPTDAPDAGRLALMTDLAVRSLPYRLAAITSSDGGAQAPDTAGTAGASATSLGAVAAAAAGTARIVLTGAGGGVWVQSFGPDALGHREDPGHTPTAPDVRIVADAVGFCRLTAGRLSTDDLGASIVGDLDLAAGILTASAAFAV